MKDIDYVKDLLTKDYPTERSNEVPYPPLNQIIQFATFDYPAGTVEGEVPNGATSREGDPYLCFKHADKRILSHRFISAVTLGRWVPRECDIDHINHNPSDNRPTNLRITTPRDNAGNRRNALLSELVDIESVGVRLEEIKAIPVVEIVPEPEPPLARVAETDEPNDGMHTRRPEHVGAPRYTGDTMLGTSSGTYFGTTFGSWHWYEDETTPASKDFVEDR
ncbi:hypothetical protein A9Q96_14125 [Rhodobacterales bacterium 52_120_T64]|nr:hypothetical protein A9Q96_14125 [Rhodobacterales bacterium 52_120_T64]